MRWCDGERDFCKKQMARIQPPAYRRVIQSFLRLDRRNQYESGAFPQGFSENHGGTENAAGIVASRLSMGGLRNVKIYDVSKTHVSELIGEAFRCGHIVLASITYNMGIFTPMKNFIMDLAAHNLQNRTYSLVENGSWSPVSGMMMKELLDGMTGMRQVGETVTIKSTTDAASYEQLTALADAVLADVAGLAAPVAAEAQAAEPTRWVCSICGYVYEGKELPEDYKCPLCGVGADKFIKE